MNKTPRVASVAATGPTTLRIKWKHGRTDDVELAGWIATGGDILAGLNDPALFARATPADYGSAIAWDDDDLRIEAHRSRTSCGLNMADALARQMTH